MIKNTNLLRILLLILPVVAGAWGLRDLGGRPTPPPLGMTPPLTMLMPPPLLPPTMPPLPPDKADLHCFLLSMKFPIYDKQGNKLPMEYFNGFNRVFQYHDLAMFEIGYGFDSGRVGDGPPVVSGTRYKYFVFQRDSASGIEYELRYPDRALHLKVDSERRYIGGFTDTSKTAWTKLQGDFPLLSSKRDVAGGSLQETYRVLDPKHPDDADTLWLWYSDRYGMLPAMLLFVHDLDSLPQMRLVRVHLMVHFHDGAAMPGSPVLPDHGEIFWKVEETPFFNRDSAAIYFTKYQRYLDSCRGRTK